MGFDVDFCRAVAAAILDNPRKVNFVPLDAKERFDELASRKVDVLARNSTWTMSRPNTTCILLECLTTTARDSW